jgi:hypothetical protein
MTQDVYSIDQLDEWEEKLEQFAQKPRTSFTKKEAVTKLLDSITRALTNSSYEEVAQYLSELGLTITAGSLKQYVTRLNRARKGKSSSGKKKAIAELTGITTGTPIVNQDQQIDAAEQLLVQKAQEKTETSTAQTSSPKSNGAIKPSKNLKQVTAANATDEMVKQDTASNSTDIKLAY